MQVAEENLKMHNVKNIELLQGNMFEPLLMKEKNFFDLIISNPPYYKSDIIESLPEQIKDYAPHNAINGGKDGLRFHREIIEKAPDFLKPGGIVILQHDNGQSELLQLLIVNSKLKLLDVFKNHKNEKRFITTYFPQVEITFLPYFYVAGSLS